jgi:catechol 2,3-dioxygenase
MTHIIRQIGHLVIETPNLDGSVSEATRLMGLRLTHRDPETAVFTSNSRRGEVTYVAGPHAAVRSVGLEVESDAAINEALRRVRNASCEIVSTTPVAPGARSGFIFRTRHAHCFEIHTPVPRDQPDDYATDGIRPRRLDHVQLMAPDVKGLAALLIETLGMELSDRSDNDAFLFLRAGDLFHHTLALIEGPPRLHHVAFEATELGDLLLVADRLRRMGRNLIWGPGHHGANAQSFFTYHQDVVGCINEYSYRTTRIADESTYQAGVWPAEPGPGQDWLNEWGAPPSELFTEGGVPVATSRYQSAVA